jgi:hypothetical protein
MQRRSCATAKDNWPASSWPTAADGRVRAKVIVDATPSDGRPAAAAFRPFVPGSQTFSRVVIGGTVRTGGNMSVEKKNFTVDVSAENGLPPARTIYARDQHAGQQRYSYFAAEHRARDMISGRGGPGAEVLYRPSDTVIGQQHLDAAAGRGPAVSAAGDCPPGVPALM